MGILIYLLIHLITYLYFIYNFYIFILINISYITIVSINDHVIDNMIRESDNLFLKAFIYHNTILSNNNTLYYTNIKLSKYKLYNTVKEYNNCASEVRTQTLPADRFYQSENNVDYLWWSPNNIIEGPGNFFDLELGCEGFTDIYLIIYIHHIILIL